MNQTEELIDLFRRQALAAEMQQRLAAEQRTISARIRELLWGTMDFGHDRVPEK